MNAGDERFEWFAILLGPCYRDRSHCFSMEAASESNNLLLPSGFPGQFNSALVRFCSTVRKKNLVEPRGGYFGKFLKLFRPDRIVGWGLACYQAIRLVLAGRDASWFAVSD